jgi:hypothetical protein
MKSNRKSLYYNNHTTKRLFLSTTFLLMMFFISILSVNTNNTVDKQEQQILTNPTNPIPDSSDNTIILPVNEKMSIPNASQYNVSEWVVYLSKLKELRYANTNLTMDIPSGWNGQQVQMNVTSVFQPYELFNDYSLNGNFNTRTYPWSNSTLYPWYKNIPSHDPYTNFTYNSIDQYAYLTAKSGDSGLPNDFYGYYYDRIQNYNKEAFLVDLDQSYQDQQQHLSINNQFITNPGYSVLIDPYGTDKKDSLVYATWISSLDALETRIDTSTSFFKKGDPSVAFATPFYVPFEADSATVTLRWSVQNLGYGQYDGFSVKARVNNAYIDGRIGVNNIVYPEGDVNSLERDDHSGEQVSHSYWERTYNITSLLGSYGFRTGWHNLDFGAYMATPLTGYADVAVNWDSVVINITHYKWYKAAELKFDYLMTDLIGSTEQDNMSLVAYIGNYDLRTTPGKFMRFYINETSNLVKSNNWMDRVTLTLKIPQTYVSALRVNSFYIMVGLEKNIRSWQSSDTTNLDFWQRLSIDTFTFNVRYILGDASSLIVQARSPLSPIYPLWHTLSPVNDMKFTIPPPEFEVQFNVVGYPNAFLKLSTAILIYKSSKNAAIASFSISDYSQLYGIWNITYNNTKSVDQFDNIAFTNNQFYYYQIVLENLPAFDGRGATSQDWFLYNVRGPGGWDATLISSKSSTNPYLQNGTLANATRGSSGSLLRGVWSALCAQQNYMVTGNLGHNIAPYTEKFYNGDPANYTLKVRNSVGQLGNYKVDMYNNTNNETSGFPVYHTNLNGINNNLTQSWATLDSGVGSYKLYSLWNDTTVQNQTKRFGWWKDTFEMWRHSSYVIYEASQGIEVPAGDVGSYHISYNQTWGNIGIDNPSIFAHRFPTMRPWGWDWPPGQYLLDSLVYTGSGNSTISLKTAGVPQTNYSLYFVISKAYFDTIITSPHVYLNISGALASFDVNYLSGAFNDTIADKLMLNSWNIPILNDTTHSKIQVMLNDSSTGDRIRDAYITANFNSSNHVMIAIEQYAFSHLEQDKGVYNITLDTSDLNYTDGVVFKNYSLSISCVRSSYRPEFDEASVKIKAVPLEIQPQSIPNVYAGDSIQVKSAIFKNFYETLMPCTTGVVSWSLYNGSGYIFGGSVPNEISNYYSTIVSLTGTYLLSQGSYWIIINATGFNLESSFSAAINFAVYKKYSSKMSIIFPIEVHIGGYFSIAAKLTFINETVIPNQEVLLTINYSTVYSFKVLVETGSDGKAIYEMSIPEYYQGLTLIVLAEFAGSGLILGSIGTDDTPILGKIPVTINFIAPPGYVQVGYNATFTMDLIIENQNSEGKIVFMFGFYNYYTGSSIQPFIIRELSTNSDGIAEYTIPAIDDGFKNITVFFEYLGDSQVENKIENYSCVIRPRWTSYFDFANIPSIIRLGQTLNMNYSLKSTNITFSLYEHFAGLPVSFLFNYTDYTVTLTYYTDENGSVSFFYTLPDTGVTELNLTVTFAGTTKILNSVEKISQIIMPKKTTTLLMTSFSTGQVFVGTYFYSITVTDQDLIPLAEVEVLFNIYSGEEIIDTVSGVTNQFGIVSVSLEFPDAGDFSVQAEFIGADYYASDLSDSVTVHVVTYLILFIEQIPNILIAAAIIAGSLFAFQRAVIIPRRIRRLEALKAIHQRFADVENIQYILILNKDGLSVFSRAFTNIPIDESLISGFLSAISSFGAEIGDRMKGKVGTEFKGLEQLSYGQFKIMVSDAALVRTAVLLLKDASPALKERVRKFNLRFQEKYMDLLQNWTGQIPSEGPILEMIEQNLEVDLIYPHNLNLAKVESYIKTIDKKSTEKAIIDQAKKPEYAGIFYVREMINRLTELGKKEIMVFNGIDTLRKGGISFAINPRTQYLIDQFRPIMSRLSVDAKKIINAILEGADSEQKLRKIKGVEQCDQNCAVLKEMGLVDDKFTLTQTGEIVATLLKLTQQL